MGITKIVQEDLLKISLFLNKNNKWETHYTDMRCEIRSNIRKEVRTRSGHSSWAENIMWYLYAFIIWHKMRPLISILKQQFHSSSFEPNYHSFLHEPISEGHSPFWGILKNKIKKKQLMKIWSLYQKVKAKWWSKDQT